MLSKFTNSFLNDFSMSEILMKFPVREFRFFERHSFIFTEGQPVSDIHFIISGKIEIRKRHLGAFRKLYYAKAGDLIGIDHALISDHYSNSAYVVQNTNTISVSKKEFSKILQCNDEFSLWLLKYLSKEINFSSLR